MRIEDFATKYKKDIRLVKDWINKGFIPGASLENNYIPDSARIPDTKIRARKGESILKAILKACNNQYGISPAIFKLSQEHFDALLANLEKEGMLFSFESDGIRYYDITFKGLESLKKYNKSEWIELGTLLVNLTPTLIQLFQVLPR